jgi:hypothetical protein
VDVVMEIDDIGREASFEMARDKFTKKRIARRLARGKRKREIAGGIAKE